MGARPVPHHQVRMFYIEKCNASATRLLIFLNHPLFDHDACTFHTHIHTFVHRPTGSIAWWPCSAAASPP